MPKHCQIQVFCLILNALKMAHQSFAGGGMVWIQAGCSGQPWHSTGSANGEVAGLICIVSGLVIPHMGKLQQNQDSLSKRESQTTIHCSYSCKSLILQPWGWVAGCWGELGSRCAGLRPAWHCCRSTGTTLGSWTASLHWRLIISINFFFL